jgi:hypothetical protein
MTKTPSSATIYANKNMKILIKYNRGNEPRRSQPHDGVCPTVGLRRPAPRRSLPHSASGFSLIELIFAVILLTVIVFGVVKLQTSTLALSNTQNNDVEAYFLANQGAEIVKALGTGPLSSCTTLCTKYISFSNPIYSLSDTAEPLIDGLYARSVEIEPITTPAPAYKVTVIVEWTDSTGEHKRMIGAQRVNAHAEAKRIIY